jgi:hypothetical protein
VNGGSLTKESAKRQKQLLPGCDLVNTLLTCAETQCHKKFLSYVQLSI